MVQAVPQYRLCLLCGQNQNNSSNDMSNGSKTTQENMASDFSYNWKI